MLDLTKISNSFHRQDEKKWENMVSTRGNGEAQPRIRNHRDLSENPTTSEYVSNENLTEGLASQPPGDVAGELEDKSVEIIQSEKKVECTCNWESQ